MRLLQKAQMYSYLRDTTLTEAAQTLQQIKQNPIVNLGEQQDAALHFGFGGMCFNVAVLPVVRAARVPR